ncbi:hypothetical protein RHGRI_016747 [Rhododendron griersonianum]|uniref:NAC domain-containing protein n=1 Tax=Rhododendron griersonianum TaxID=479676 RepID=A0AAV6JVB4_9ERIC|nr:hypothetical protein RHGRI_016747 [Rhododendron griersonianum]KAG5544102.1 hypothetical protein RHGRI_016747 [Rhododendron griersonianum]
MVLAAVVDGDDQRWPPGFRFHPTDEELVLYYLKRKICRRRLKLDIIAETDVYKWDPEDLPGLSKLKTGDRLWFFFSPRDRKYPNGARSNRATRQGYWKATGKDRTITCNSRSVGVKKTLVFYKGRAPSGERTDWVMHEYTLDEEELKRCPTAQDYYALYKVYKKSGPGPKNGEQYGAPFREEEWADDENTNSINGCADIEKSAYQVNDIAAVANTRTNGQVQQSPFNDLEEFMNRLAADETLAVDYGYGLQEGFGEEENLSTLVDQSLTKTNLHEIRQNDAQPNFELTQSAASHWQHYEISEVTSAPVIYRQESHESELDDFLEIDDLIGPGLPTVPNTESNPLFENLHFEDIDGLSELDLYQDAAMFLRDMGPINSEPPHPHSYFNNETVNQLGYQFQQHSSDGSQITSQVWMHDQRSIVTPAEYNQEFIPPPTPGVVCDGSSNLPVVVNQNQSGKEDDGGDSWFSSALWAFVESIPTTPASASESAALVNKAFERMSSFSRIGVGARISAGETRLAAVNPTATRPKSSSKYNRGFLLFAVLGIVCAIWWVLTGTSVRVLGRYLSS